MSPEYIKDILQKIRTEYDIDELANYRKFFKKHVPFFMRSWAAAAMMLELDRADIPRRSGLAGKLSRNSPRSAGKETGRSAARDKSANTEGRKPREKREGIPADQARDVPVRVSIPEDEASTLFFSAGRKRRVFPRDIVGFILKETQIDRNDIGDIRILDNFSFIQVRKSSADTLIGELNGTTFRGRSLTVSYAKPRPDQDDEGIDETNGKEDTADSQNWED